MIEVCYSLQILQSRFKMCKKFTNYLKHELTYITITLLYSVLCYYNTPLNGINTLVFLWHEPENPTFLGQLKLTWDLKILTVVTVLIMFFWVKLPCWFVGRSQHIREACCLHLQGWSDQPGLRVTIYIYIHTHTHTHIHIHTYTHTHTHTHTHI
jgi:hypothetical protein